MKHNWETKRISELAFQDTESSVQVKSDQTYSMVGVYSYGKGLFNKESILGMNTSYKIFYQLKVDHIVMSQLFGWEGAIALSSIEYEGKFVSSQFPTFLVKETIADKRFVSYFLQQRIIWEKLYEVGVGMGSRRRTLNPSNLLNLNIPLPPLPEQQRIVAKIESIKNSIEEIQRLRAEQEKEMKNLAYSRYAKLIKGVDWKPMKAVAPIIRREVVINQNKTYPEMGIRSFGKGTFHKPSLTGLEVGTKKLYKIKTGDLMFSNVFAWEGAIAVTKDDDDGRYGSHRFISCLVNKNYAIAEFLCFHFLTPKGLEDINFASPGGAGRNKTLGLEKLMKINVPIPKIEEQMNFVSFLDKLTELTIAHHETEKELSQLMPALLDKAFKGEL